jgi:hypothetical protein
MLSLAYNFYGELLAVTIQADDPYLNYGDDDHLVN